MKVIHQPFAYIYNSKPNINWFAKYLNWLNFMNSGKIFIKDFMSNMSWSASLF